VKALFSSREGHFFLHRIRGIRAIKRRACPITSERHIGELGVRYLSTLNRGQDSPATVSDYEAIILLIAIEREVWQRKDIEHQSPALDAIVWVFHPVASPPGGHARAGHTHKPRALPPENGKVTSTG